MDPKRLLETEPGLSRTLLRAGLSVSEPPPRALARAMTSVGLAGEPPDLDGEPPSLEPSAGAGGFTAPFALGIAKYVLSGTVGGLLVSAIAVAVTAPDSSRAPSPEHAASTRASAPAVIAAPTPLAPSRHVPTPSAAPLQRAPSATAPAQSVESERTEGALADEVKLLDRAAAALASGSTTQCLKLLNEYRWRFPGGQLELEAELQRVRAEHSAGNHPRARQLADALLARSGTGAFAARVRAAAGMANDKSQAGPIKP